MTQKSFHWDGASIGDADAITVVSDDGIGYRLANSDYESPFVDIALRMLFNGDEDRGVLWGYANALQVTGVGSPIQVDTGGAVVYGMPYVNTAALNIAVASPTNDNRNDLVVLRRNWTAQTIRATVITGSEGGGVPAHVQSPSPPGSGIYDIPLASLEITPAGVITVTDLRQYCQYGMGIRPGGIDTAQLSNNVVDWAERPTTTKRLFLPAGDFRPLTSGAYWTLVTGDTRTWTATPIWNGTALSQGWRLTGAARLGIYTTFTMPADWVDGSAISSKIWWIVNTAGTYTAYLYAAVSMLCQNVTGGTGKSSGLASSEQYLSGTLIASHAFASDGPYGSFVSGGTYVDRTFQYLVEWYNSAGTENVNILGVEIDYTGYV